MRTPRRGSAFEQAEAAFKAVTKRNEPTAKGPVIPPAGKEMVSLRLDRDVLAHFSG